MRRFSVLAALAAAALLAPAVSRAASCDQPSPVVFATATRSATIEGALARGEQACFTVRSPDGRTLAISANDPTGNTVFQLYDPGWRVENPQGFYTVAGPAIPGTAPGQDTHAWTGKLSRAGDTLLVIGLVRGGGPFKAILHLQ